MTERFRTNACPYCGKDNTSCAEIVSLSTAWIRQACMTKHKGVPLRKLSTEQTESMPEGL